jgi:hypothetical protein
MDLHEPAELASVDGIEEEPVDLGLCQRPAAEPMGEADLARFPPQGRERVVTRRVQVEDLRDERPALRIDFDAMRGAMPSGCVDRENQCRRRQSRPAEDIATPAPYRREPCSRRNEIF